MCVMCHLTEWESVGQAEEERRGEARKEGSIVLARPSLHPIRMHISIVCMYVYVSMHTAQAQRQGGGSARVRRWPSLVRTWERGREAWCGAKHKMGSHL
jgi:hypothetical protein